MPTDHDEHRNLSRDHPNGMSSGTARELIPIKQTCTKLMGRLVNIFLDRSTVFDADHDVDVSTMPVATFDAYSFTVSAFVIENATNMSVPIVTFAAGEAPNNFVVPPVETETKRSYTIPGQGRPR
jgi:hypothetical protein